MSQLCYTCSRTVEDAVAVRCTRPYCQAKKEQAKDEKIARGVRPQDKPIDWNVFGTGPTWDDYPGGSN